MARSKKKHSSRPQKFWKPGADKPQAGGGGPPRGRNATAEGERSARASAAASQKKAVALEAKKKRTAVKSLSSNVLGLKFMKRKQDEEDAKQELIEQRRQARKAQWVVKQSEDEGESGAGADSGGALICVRDDTVGREDDVFRIEGVSRRSFGRFNDAFEPASRAEEDTSELAVDDEDFAERMESIQSMRAKEGEEKKNNKKKKRKRGGEGGGKKLSKKKKSGGSGSGIADGRRSGQQEVVAERRTRK